MAKLKPVKGKAKGPRTRPEGVSCVILLLSAFVLFLFFLYFVLKNANG
jgi:hypothetical protein